MPVSEVTSADVLEILAPIWHTKADTARRLRQRIRAVLEWAVAMEFRIDNPCDRIDPVLGPQRDVVQHMRALPHREVAAAIQTARASTVPLAVRLAFEFLVLTAARWGEVRWAEWTEIDRENGVWTVPAKRMKSNREHRVPLCGRALEILDGARTLVKGTSPYLFPNRLGKQLEEKQLRRILGKHKIAAVPHGFRSSFRDWAAEETDHPRDSVHGLPVLDDEIPEREAAAGGAERADQGSGSRATTLGVPSHLGPTPTRGVAGQPQTGSAALSRGRARGAA